VGAYWSVNLLGFWFRGKERCGRIGWLGKIRPKPDGTQRNPMKWLKVKRFYGITTISQRLRSSRRTVFCLHPKKTLRGRRSGVVPRRMSRSSSKRTHQPLGFYRNALIIPRWTTRSRWWACSNPTSIFFLTHLQVIGPKATTIVISFRMGMCQIVALWAVPVFSMTAK